uniref:Uncharacterized protein n=1 Tax=Arcella intermedia TaxID=1963864 RepID=A0A6B2L6H3_9EUKA
MLSTLYLRPSFILRILPTHLVILLLIPLRLLRLLQTITLHTRPHLRLRLRKNLQKLLRLLRTQRTRKHHREQHKEVPILPRLANDRHALLGDNKGVPGVDGLAVGDEDLAVVEVLHELLGPGEGVDEGDLELEEEVVAFPLEGRAVGGLGLEDIDKVPGHAVWGLVGLAVEEDLLVPFHSPLDLDGELLVFCDDAVSVAFLALVGVGDGVASASAGGADDLPLDAHEALRLDFHSDALPVAPLALGAHAGFRAGALAAGADDAAAVRDVFFEALVEVREADFEGLGHVLGLLGALLTPAAAKEGGEEVEGVRGVEAGLAEAFFAKLVVDFSLLLVGKDFVGFVDLFEFLFCFFFVVWVLVWVPFLGGFVKGFLDFRF